MTAMGRKSRAKRERRERQRRPQVIIDEVTTFTEVQYNYFTAATSDSIRRAMSLAGNAYIKAPARWALMSSVRTTGMTRAWRIRRIQFLWYTRGYATRGFGLDAEPNDYRWLHGAHRLGHSPLTHLIVEEHCARNSAPQIKPTIVEPFPKLDPYGDD